MKHKGKNITFEYKGKFTRYEVTVDDCVITCTVSNKDKRAFLHICKSDSPAALKAVIPSKFSELEEDNSYRRIGFGEQDEE